MDCMEPWASSVLVVLTTSWLSNRLNVSLHLLYCCQKGGVSLLDAVESSSSSKKAKKHDNSKGFGSISNRKRGKAKKKKR